MAVVKGLVKGSLIWRLLHVHASTASSLRRQAHAQTCMQTKLQMQYHTAQLALRNKTWHKHHNARRRYAALKKRVLFPTELKYISLLLNSAM